MNNWTKFTADPVGVIPKIVFPLVSFIPVMIFGVVRLGDVPKTSDPLPVSSVKAAEIPEEAVVPVTAEVPLPISTPVKVLAPVPPLATDKAELRVKLAKVGEEVVDKF